MTVLIDRLCIIACVVVACVISSTLCEASFRVKLNDHGQFVDDFGRVRMFHGINSVMKGAPWYDPQILNETRLGLYAQWGFNVVRLGTMWSGLQPTESQYNASYIAILLQIVNRLETHGIYSLLDMHQDVISSKFDTYDGVPLWLIEKFPKVPKELEFPFPLERNISHFWGDYYATYAAGDAFQSLYSTEVGLGNWVTIWGKIASIFSKQTAVIGYELLNEPWVGNFYMDPRRLLPGFAGRTNLMPAYDRIVENIRQIDNDTLVFYEPVTFGAYWPTTGDLGTGFDHVPGGPSQRSKSVLSYHFYCFLLATANASENYSTWVKSLCDDFFGEEIFKSVMKNVQSTGGGSMLTEFGGCQPDGNALSINTIECDANLRLADSHYQSYTYWDSVFFDDDGAPKTDVVKTFARAYPRAVQGQPISYSFDRINATMNLVFSIDLNIKGPTEIFIPINVHYDTGFKNETTPEMVTGFDGQKFLFYVIAPENMKQGSNVSVRITPLA